MAHASSLETKEQILDVAECAIAQNGYAGTTLRSVVSKANVNLAAIHYHFGSKEDLFRAVLARISGPIVSGQLTELEALITPNNPAPPVKAIIKAYLVPALTCAMFNKDAHPLRSQFISRCRTEPEPVQSIASEQFQPSTEKFLDVLQKSLPNQTRSQLTWKLDLVVTVLIRTLAQAGKPGALIDNTLAEDTRADNKSVAMEKAVAKLVDFVLPGIEKD